MFDYLRDITRSPAAKQEDALSAYLDGALSPAETARVEALLAEDEALQAQLAAMKVWQQQLRTLPSRPVPRNFTLDPAAFRAPRRQPLARSYPALRTATAMAAIMFVIALAALLGGVSTSVPSQAVSVAMQSPPGAETLAEPAQEEMAVETAAEAPAAAMIAEDMGTSGIPGQEEAFSKASSTPSPLDELAASAGLATGAAGETPQPAPFAQEEIEPAAPMDSARSFPESGAPTAAAESAVANDAGTNPMAMGLLVVTLILGGLFLLLLILTLLAQRQR